MLVIVIRIKARIIIAYKALQNPSSQLRGLGEATDPLPWAPAALTLSSTQQPSPFCLRTFACAVFSAWKALSHPPLQASLLSLGLSLLVTSSRKLSESALLQAQSVLFSGNSLGFSLLAVLLVKMYKCAVFNVHHPLDSPLHEARSPSYCIHCGIPRPQDSVWRSIRGK